EFLEACTATSIEAGINWIETLFRLGSLDTVINPAVVSLYLAFLIAVALLDQPSRVEIPAMMKVAALLAAGMAGGLILMPLSVWWSPVGGDYIEGIQGRYCLPLLPVLLNHRASRIEAAPRALLIITATGSGGMLWISVATMIQRYYFSEP